MELIIPDSNKHEYVIGIDFGHGETSAAKCLLEWDKPAGISDQNVLDIDMNREAKKKVIKSVICKTADDKYYLSDDAFHFQNLGNGSQLRIGFKAPPTKIDGEDEQLMIAFMKIVYERIRKYEPDLTDDNHIVYIARPSGWNDKETKDYQQMALNAGIPLAGLTSESRAAIFYAINAPKINFRKEISKGVIVFDLGSSTLDFTYLSEEVEDICDSGFPLGASIIEQTIYNDKIANREEVKSFLSTYPQYADKLLFEARLIKEDAYSTAPILPKGDTIVLGDQMSPESEDYAKYAEKCIPVKFKNIKDLNDYIDDKTLYSKNIKEALIDFREKYIQNKPLNGVFLTGGASRMNFITPLIEEVYNLTTEQVKIDPDDPSLTISRGIAMLGRADCVSEILAQTLKKEMQNYDCTEEVIPKCIDSLSNNIMMFAWKVVHSELITFKESKTDININELESQIRGRLTTDIQTHLETIFTETIMEELVSESEKIRIRLNNIINLYAPGQELKQTAIDVNADTSSITKELSQAIDRIVKMCIESVIKTASKVVKDVLWVILGFFLWGAFALTYYVGKYLWNKYKSEERKEKEKRKVEEKMKKEPLNSSKRQKAYDRIIRKEETIKIDIKKQIEDYFNNDKSFTIDMSNLTKSYFDKLINENIERVKIRIK